MLTTKAALIHFSFIFSFIVLPPKNFVLLAAQDSLEELFDAIRNLSGRRETLGLAASADYGM
jgi:hypothetical protein